MTSFLTADTPTYVPLGSAMAATGLSRFMLIRLLDRRVIRALTGERYYFYADDLWQLAFKASARNMDIHAYVQELGRTVTRGYPPEKREQARRLYREGKTIAEISEIIGISPNAVFERVMDLTRRRGPRPQPTIPDDVIVRMRDTDGRVWREIADAAGQSISMVRYRYLRATDVTDP